MDDIRFDCDLLLMKKSAVVVLIALLMGAIVLLGTTAQNEGCLPWQERVGVGDGVFGEREDVTRCSGSRFPWGSVLLPVATAGPSLRI